MRKCIAFILMLVFVLGTNIIGQAKSLYDKYWEPGTYIFEITGEDQARYTALWEQVQSLSNGTLVRKTNEAETLEVQYEKYLQMGEIPERIYDDVGSYTWAVGLPDEKAIPQKEAYIRACMALEQQYNLQFNLLLHYWPHFSYITADPEHPVWQIDFICFDGTRDRTATVVIYANDGSICGVKYEKAFG